MKKLKFIFEIISFGAATFFTNHANAQKGGGDGNTFEVGTMTVSIGAGLGRSGYGSVGVYGGLGYTGYGTGIGVKAVIERGMWQLGPGVLSLGLEAGGSFSNAHYNGYGYSSDIIIAAARAAYHFGWNVDRLDTYAGFSVGPGFRSYGYSPKVHDVVVSPGGFVGGTYFFSPNIGVNVEAGYDITEIQGGIIFKLN